MILCKLVSHASKGVIDERVINLPSLTSSSATSTSELSTGLSSSSSSSSSSVTVPLFLRNTLNPWQIAENIQLCLGTARSLGCKILNVHTADIINQTSYLVLGILWQVIRVSLLTPVSIQYHKELLYLLEPTEELKTFLRLPPEDILLRWLNYHLRKVFAPLPPVTDFASQLQNGNVYAYLLYSLSQTYLSSQGIEQFSVHPKDPSLLLTSTTTLESIIHTSSVPEKVQRLLEICRNGFGLTSTFITVNDIVLGNRRLNLLFISQIFDAFPGILAPTTAQATATSTEVALTVPLLMENPEEQRESKVFRNWLNSLELFDNDGNPIYLTNLYTELADGIVLLKAIDHIIPGIVNWKSVTTNPSKLNKYKRIENTNYVVKLGKEILKFSLPGIGGIDITDSNTKLILAYLWQLMRLSLFRLLDSIQTTLRTGSTTSTAVVQSKGETVVNVTPNSSSGCSGSSSVSSVNPSPRPTMNDDEIIRWAIDMTKNHHYTQHTLSSLKDPLLANSLFLLDLLRCIEANVLNPQFVHTDIHSIMNDKEKLYENARYTISVARKLGCLLFITPEDIVEVKSKMVLTFIIAIIYRYQQKKVPSPVDDSQPQEGEDEKLLLQHRSLSLTDSVNNRRLPILPTGTSTSSTETKQSPIHPTNEEQGKSKNGTSSSSTSNSLPLPPRQATASSVSSSSSSTYLPLPPRKDTFSGKNNVSSVTSTGTVPMVSHGTPMNEATKRYLATLHEQQQQPPSTSTSSKKQ